MSVFIKKYLHATASHKAALSMVMTSDCLRISSTRLPQEDSVTPLPSEEGQTAQQSGQTCEV